MPEERAVDHFGLDLTLIVPRLTKIGLCAKTFFTFSFPVTLTFDL